MPMNPDALDPTARTGGTGLPGTGSSSGKKGKRRDWEQMQPASPSLSSLKETKSGKQKHLFSTFLPSLCPLGNLPPPSAGWHSTTLHTHPLTPSCPHRVPEQHPQRLHRATDRDTDRHTHRYTHPRGAGEGRQSPAGAYLGGRRQLPDTAQSEPPRSSSPASSQELLTQARPEARHRAAGLHAHSHRRRRHLQHPPLPTAGTNRIPPQAPPRTELGKCSLGSGAMGRWVLSFRPERRGRPKQRSTPFVFSERRN